ncbi:MAG: hypothetical protein WCG36_03660 [bacterium]
MKPKKVIDPTLVGPSLQDCGDRFSLATDYQIAFEPGRHLIVEAGGWLTAATAQFRHPNVWQTRCRVYELKQYLRSGAKRWRSRAGISHYLVIPRDRILLYLEKGYSYVRVLINGVLCSLNVSGGGGEGWTDYVGASACIGIGHSRSDLQKIAEVACSPGEVEALGLQQPKQLEPDERNRFIRLVAAAIVPAKLKATQLHTGAATIQLADGYRYGVSQELKVSSFKQHGRRVFCHGVMVRYHQVDWIRTAELNGITYLDPAWEESLQTTPARACA